MEYTKTSIIAQGKREKRDAEHRTYVEEKSKELIGLVRMRKKRAMNNIREKRSGKNHPSISGW